MADRPQIYSLSTLINLNRFITICEGGTVDDLRKVIEEKNAEIERLERSTLILLAAIAYDRGGEVRISDMAMAAVSPATRLWRFEDEGTMETVFRLTNDDRAKEAKP